MMSSGETETEIVTGDQPIEPITRSQSAAKEKVFGSLPKEIRFQLFPEVKKFNGSNCENSNEWLENIKIFIAANELEAAATLDLFLDGDARKLWRNNRETKKR